MLFKVSSGMLEKWFRKKNSNGQLSSNCTLGAELKHKFGCLVNCQNKTILAVYSILNTSLLNCWNWYCDLFIFFVDQLIDEWVIWVDLFICNSVSITASYALRNVILFHHWQHLFYHSQFIIDCRLYNRSTSSAWQFIADSCWLTSIIRLMKSLTGSFDFIFIFIILDFR